MEIKHEFELSETYHASIECPKNSYKVSKIRLAKLLAAFSKSIKIDKEQSTKTYTQNDSCDKEYLAPLDLKLPRGSQVLSYHLKNGALEIILKDFHGDENSVASRIRPSPVVIGGRSEVKTGMKVCINYDVPEFDYDSDPAAPIKKMKEIESAIKEVYSTPEDRAFRRKNKKGSIFNP